MSDRAPVSLATLRLRRDALLRQAALQRLSLSSEVATLLAPMQTGLAGRLTAHGKLPLLAGAAALGLALARPKRILALAMAAASLWKTARGLLPLLRRAARRSRARGNPY